MVAGSKPSSMFSICTPHATGAGGGMLTASWPIIAAIGRVLSPQAANIFCDQPADVRYKIIKTPAFSPDKAVRTLIPDQLQRFANRVATVSPMVERAICFEEFLQKPDTGAPAGASSNLSAENKDRNAVGAAHGRLHQVRPGHRSQALMSQIYRHRARHTDSERAEMIRAVLPRCRRGPDTCAQLRPSALSLGNQKRRHAVITDR